MQESVRRIIEGEESKMGKNTHTHTHTHTHPRLQTHTIAALAAVAVNCILGLSGWLGGTGEGVNAVWRLL